mgnify:CR=1 FL=1
MLSILIPTHDYNAYPLVESLHQQAELLVSVPYEIILVEDGSRDTVSMIANLKVSDLTHCHYIRRRENVGRSAIRNYLMTEAQGDWLLFMDADGKVVRPDFLQKYVDAAQHHAVVCGGVVHPDQWHDPHRMLRWKYEKAYERKYGNISEQFRSFSFLIHSTVADRVRFDERYDGYGYEDVQFGQDLIRAGYTIHPINNPLLNNDIEDNSTFLRKTEEALRAAHRHRHDIGHCVKIHQIYSKYKPLSPLMQMGYKLFAPLLRRNLLSAHPSLVLFNLYKLGYYACLKD